MDGIASNQLTYPSRQLPVLFEGQAIIAGGTFAGISTALRLARAGWQVMLVEPRTYLGWEAMACLRPWICFYESETITDLPEVVRECLYVSESEPRRPSRLTKSRMMISASISLNIPTVEYSTLPKIKSESVGVFDVVSSSPRCGTTLNPYQVQDKPYANNENTYQGLRGSPSRASLGIWKT